MPEARRTRRRTLHSKGILPQFTKKQQQQGVQEAQKAQKWHQEQLHKRLSPIPLSALDAAAELQAMMQGLPEGHSQNIHSQAHTHTHTHIALD